MKVYASISGGKDSLAALITHMERGGQCDGAIYCRIMFDDETSAEVPEHEEWLHSKCFPLLEREYGIKTQIVQGKYTYTDCFYKQYEKGGEESIKMSALMRGMSDESPLRAIEAGK